ncbi:MAG: hypothetical protein UT24_C0003G0081 [Candidatus Woesebacteria bacterium GW2011_GWB1_39_12]|uniref:Uncharacterized protein n=1 Tax=Candidatus Woesebacteria bacterium GW2011_GWB1_39_12 TaxID=1618574 RepID=A0A0G0MCB1_9BACT|nr:MAG: hypothetical protein UT24_C0003G0081 [Candidatus Woesebacteria bacterium GW2011_GWB1_39_12]
MSEKKKRQTNLWAVNLSRLDDPLLKCLEKEAEVSNLIRPDGSINKSRLMETLASEALQMRFQKRGYMEGLGLLAEYRRRRETIEAIATGKPLPSAMLAQPIPQTATPTTPTVPVSESTPIPSPTQTTPTPAKPSEKKPRREGTFIISSSGHMRESK